MPARAQGRARPADCRSTPRRRSRALVSTRRRRGRTRNAQTSPCGCRGSKNRPSRAIAGARVLRRLSATRSSPPHRRSRAKSAPVQARIVRFQAVNSGFAAPHSRGDQQTESRSTVRKTAQESRESARLGETRLSGRPVFKTGAFNRSATLPRATTTKASRFAASRCALHSGPFESNKQPWLQRPDGRRRRSQSTGR